MRPTIYYDDMRTWRYKDRYIKYEDVTTWVYEYKIYIKYNKLKYEYDTYIRDNVTILRIWYKPIYIDINISYLVPSRPYITPKFHVQTIYNSKDIPKNVLYLTN